MAIAVLDVGKTNKKVIVYDENLNIIEEQYASFVADESGAVHVERTEEAWAWFLGALGACAKKHAIKAISITTHGATFAALDEAGNPAFPVLAYTTPVTPAFEQGFFRKCGGSARDLHRELATPNLGGLVCQAKGIAFAQEHFPNDWKRVKTILNLPQYFGFKLTGQKAVDTTFLGCHTYLYDFARSDWSRIADRLGIRGLVPATVQHPQDILGKISPEIARQTGLSPDTIVTVGIHDSNASLIPLLITNDKPFVLNSTGTWCVAMCPAHAATLSETDLDRGAFYNCDAFGQPVKTTNFMGGQEREVWWGLITKASGSSALPPFDPNLYNALLKNADTFFLPGVMPGTGPFPASKSALVEKGNVYSLESLQAGVDSRAILRNAPHGAAVLNCSLAVQSYQQLLGAGVVDGMPIYIEGGFRKNPDYVALIGSLFPKSPVMLTDMQQATALGAALLAQAALSGQELHDLGRDFKVDCRPAPQVRLDGVQHYREAFVRAIYG